MTETKIAQSQAHAETDEGVLCAKCEHLNAPDTRRCSSCGAHLYVTCLQCGHRNQRVHSRCEKCGHHLHRTLWRRWRKKLFPDKRKLKLWHIPLFLATVFIVYKVIVKLAEWRFPGPG